MIAGGWIKVRASLMSSPRLLAMANELYQCDEFREWLIPGYGNDPEAPIVGDDVLRCVTCALLIRVWSAAREFGKYRGDDLILSRLSLADLDRISGAPGVGDAIARVGWAVWDREANAVVLPNFREHNVVLTAAEKQKLYRERKAAGSEADSNPLPRVTRPCNKRDTNVTLQDSTVHRGKYSPNTPSCSEAERPPPEPAVLTFPTTGEVKEWHLTRKHIDEWKAAFPALDIEGECRRALAWVNANPGKRKTARGMPRFLVAWLERSQNSGAGGRAGGGGSHARPGDAVGPGSRVRPPEGKYDNLDDSWLFAPGAPGEAARPLAPRGDAECPPD